MKESKQAMCLHKECPACFVVGSVPLRRACRFRTELWLPHPDAHYCSFDLPPRSLLLRLQSSRRVAELSLTRHDLLHGCGFCCIICSSILLLSLSLSSSLSLSWYREVVVVVSLPCCRCYCRCCCRCRFGRNVRQERTVVVVVVVVHTVSNHLRAMRCLHYPGVYGVV